MRSEIPLFVFLKSHKSHLFSTLRCLCVIKADSPHHVVEGWRGPGGEAASQSKELQQDDSDPKSLFRGCW